MIMVALNRRRLGDDALGDATASRFRPASTRVRSGLAAGGKWIRTTGPPPEIVVDPSGSRRDQKVEVGMSFGETESSMSLPSRDDSAPAPKVSLRPTRVRLLELGITTLPDAGPMVRLCHGNANEPALRAKLAKRHAAATASCHCAVASALKIRSVDREMRWR